MSARRYRDQIPNYDKFPEVALKGMDGQAWSGWDALAPALEKAIHNRKGQNEAAKTATVLTVDCYSAINDREVLGELKARLKPALVVEVQEALLPEAALNDLLSRDLTDDRVFGVMTNFRIGDFFDRTKLACLRDSVEAAQGLVLVYGIGASLVHPGDVLVYADMARWEIQLRYRRKEACNWGATNYEEDFLRKYKRSFFIEWRVLDRHKRQLFTRMDFVLDTNRPGDPAMATGTAHREALRQAVRRPFRLVPFFDPGPWGGQWMKEICQLDPGQANYAWCFDCVPEENSLYLNIGGVKLEIPSINLVFLQPVELLGDKVHARFGAEFPIRFDFLDTMDGGNLSLQVHPLTEYIQEEFGMHYTQDESYYLLDAQEDATVFLGVKTGIDARNMLADLQAAQAGMQPFPDRDYINQWPAKKHDHFLIPAGTVHCSGKNAMVLEISATPYIFTFKLWDWDRLGLDGRPRPVHLEHGAKNIQWHRNTEWVQKNLVNRIEPSACGPGWWEERTGLHEREFIETRRTWFDGPVTHHTHGSVNVLNLVEGSAVIVESPSGAFEPFEVHYAETFIVPAAVGTYVIRPAPGVSGKCGTIKAYVRA
ncbi:MAG: class I mannose-6-phosphate isomerase [Chloroflexota bacterium]